MEKAGRAKRPRADPREAASVVLRERFVARAEELEILKALVLSPLQ